MQENLVREWVQDGVLNVLHVKGRVNPADIFTKEMWDGAHFWCLHDSFMCRLSLLVIHHSHLAPQPVPTQVVPSAALSRTVYAHNSYFLALCSSPLCWTFSAVSHLSSAGHHLLQCLHHIVPSGLLWDPTSLGFGSFSAGFFSLIWLIGFTQVGGFSCFFLLCHGRKGGGCCCHVSLPHGMPCWQPLLCSLVH